MTDAEDVYREPKTGHAFFPTDENVLYSFDIEALKKGGKKRPKPKARTVKGKEPAPVATGGGHSPFLRNTSGGSGTTTQTHHGLTTTPSSAKTVIQLLGAPEDPFGGYITKTKFDAITKHGCSYCRNPIEWGQKGVIIFERDDTILCPKCALGGESGVTRILVKDFERLN